MAPPHDLDISAIRPEELARAALILTQMNQELQQEEIAERLRALLETYPHYSCLAARLDGEVVGVSGYWIAERIWCGKYIEADNVAVAKGYQGRGIGAALMQSVEDIGKQLGCQMAILDSYTSNRASHRFYHRLGYEIYGFHFVKPLAEAP